MLKLQAEDLPSYEALLRTRRQPWGRLPEKLVQPAHRCIAHLISILIVTCQGGSSRDPSLGLILTHAQAKKYMKKASAR